MRFGQSGGMFFCDLIPQDSDIQGSEDVVCDGVTVVVLRIIDSRYSECLYNENTG